MGSSRPCFHVDGQTEYSRLQGHALYLVGPARRSVLWTVKTDWNNHRRSVSNAIDAFEPSIESGRNTTRDTIKWFCSMTMLDPMLRKWSRHTWKRWNGNSTPPAVFSRRCSLWLSLVSINGIRPGWPALSVDEEIKNWIDSWIVSKDDQFFRRGIRALSERWESSAMDNILNQKNV